MYVYVCMQYVKLTRQTPSNGAFSSLLSLPHSLTHSTRRCGGACQTVGTAVSLSFAAAAAVHSFVLLFLLLLG